EQRERLLVLLLELERVHPRLVLRFGPSALAFCLANGVEARGLLAFAPRGSPSSLFFLRDPALLVGALSLFFELLRPLFGEHFFVGLAPLFELALGFEPHQLLEGKKGR